MPDPHTERPTRLAGGRTYCACGALWPCEHATRPVADVLAHDAGTLTEALTLWATRDDSKAEPHVREAANVALDTIDAMLHHLQTTRAALVGEMRRSDDAVMARTEALLAEGKTRSDGESG